VKGLLLAATTASIAAGSFALAATPSAAAFEQDSSSPAVAFTADSRPAVARYAGDPEVTVSPRRGLFEVDLAPGDLAYRTITVTNDGDAPIRLALTAVQTAWSGHPDNPEHLRFSIARQADTACTETSHPVAPWMPLNEVNALDRGLLAPQQSEQYCAAITLPANTDLPASARSNVDFLLDAIIMPTASNEGARRLAFTGADLSTLLFVALGVVSTGLSVLLLRRRRSPAADTTTLARSTNERPHP